MIFGAIEEAAVGRVNIGVSSLDAFEARLAIFVGPAYIRNIIFINQVHGSEQGTYPVCVNKTVSLWVAMGVGRAAVNCMKKS
jgi:hypothetical protein